MISLQTLFWLLGGMAIGSQHHQPSGPHLSRVSSWAANHQFPQLCGGFITGKTAQRYCYIHPLRGSLDFIPRLHYCFFWLVIPSLISVHLDLLLNSVKVKKAEWSLFSVIEKLGTQKGFCAQKSSAKTCLVSLGGPACWTHKLAQTLFWFSSMITTPSILSLWEQNLGQERQRPRDPEKKIIHCEVIKLGIFEYIQVIKSDKQKRYLKECPSAVFLWSWLSD